jgi:creatinine amidohydrolase/Fe(II)-dependent formamide hydrolase-like protein
MRVVIVGLLFCLSLAGGARGDAGTSVYIEDLTWTELRDQLAAGKSIAIVPLGGTEQNGPHMAIGKHNLRVKLLAGKIAAALGTALVAPVLSYVPEGGLNPPAGHMRFPGTITVPEDTFEKTIEYAARSLQLHGFRDIVFLGDHGSTQTGEEAVARRLNREWAAKPARVHAIVEYYRASESGFGRLLEGRGYPADEVGTHAGLADTALMMALDPALVRSDRLKPGEGVSGDPRRATAELGALGVTAIVDQTVAAIKQSVARH